MKDIERLSIDYIMKMRYACLCERVLGWERSEIGRGQNGFMEGRVHQREPNLRWHRTGLSSSWISLVGVDLGGRGVNKKRQKRIA